MKKKGRKRKRCVVVGEGRGGREKGGKGVVVVGG